MNAAVSELEERIASSATAAERLDALNQLAWQIRTSDSARAHELAVQARELAEEVGDKLGRARATRTMAMTVYDADNLRRVFELGEEAKRLFDEVGDAAGRAASRDFLATLLEFTGDLNGSLDLALDALSIARELGDPVRQGYALSNVGGVLAKSGEVDTAVQRLSEALELFDGVGDVDGAGAICSRLAEVLVSAERFDEAIAHAERCRSIAQQTSSEFLMCSALTVLARVQSHEGNVRESEQLYRAAIAALGSDLARTVVGSETQVVLGRMLMDAGELDAAERELLDCLARVSDKDILIVNQTAAREALAELYERRGQLAEAIEHLRRAHELRERIAERDARNKLAQIEVRAAAEAARKDAEIHRLRYVELHAMQAKLVEAEKTALLGKLAAGTAHELNTPLGVLSSNAQLMRTAATRLLSLVDAEQEPAARKIATALESTRATSAQALERISAIVHSFQRFTQLDQAERRAFDVREGLEDALLLLTPSIPGEVEVERHFHEVPALHGWPRELNHAFYTVLRNAVEAIEGPGTVTVETSREGDWVCVCVRDTGRGMTSDQLGTLFEVAWDASGVRTKMRLGLSAARATVSEHGGTLDVESAPGSGTAFTFRLPIEPAR